MKKIISILIICLVIFSLFGCTQEEGTTTKVTNDAEVASTIDDVGSDITGIANSLDDIDNTLTQEPN